ncbi:MAG: molecular chaperone DnaJ [Acidimicrobiia bacterium]
MTQRDYYEVLGVPRSATEDDIKKAYRRLAREHHPDANQNDESAEERFKEVQRAYETLREPERRRRYDTFGTDDARAGATDFGGGAFGLNDLFDAFFGGGTDPFGRSHRNSGPPRGPDAEIVLDLTLADVVFGVRKTVEPRMPVECEPCGGSGAAPGTRPAPCATCGGSGEVRQVRRSVLGQLVTAAPCQTCEGTGEVLPSPCEHCRGAGRVAGQRSLDVEVPAGIDDGQRLRLAGRGPAAPRGGEAGDLYVSVRVAPDPVFERHGDDLYRRLPVSIVQAALGTHVTIDTLDGEQDLDIATGTQYGTQLRLRGLGAPSLRSGRRGDLICEVVVEVPRNLTAEEGELLAQFAELRGEEVKPPREGLFSRIRSAFQ